MNTPAPYGPYFATTEWSVVCAARGDDTTVARAALARLCETYWYPLYAYVRRRGHSPDDAQDLTQEFFARLLEHDWLVKVDRAKGRFRWFLLMAMKRFLANEWHKARARKRGGNVRIESLSSETAERRFEAQAAVTTSPEFLFEREWAITLLDRVLGLLAQEYRDAGRAALFDALKPFLTPTAGEACYDEAACALEMTNGAVRVAVCRLRERYREQLRREIGRTVAQASDVESELRHLARILAKC